MAIIEKQHEISNKAWIKHYFLQIAFVYVTTVPCAVLKPALDTLSVSVNSRFLGGFLRGNVVQAHKHPCWCCTQVLKEPSVSLPIHAMLKLSARYRTGQHRCKDGRQSISVSSRSNRKSVIYEMKISTKWNKYPSLKTIWNVELIKNTKGVQFLYDTVCCSALLC